MKTLKICVKLIFICSRPHAIKYMLQVNLFLRSICFQPRSMCSNLGQFVPTEVNLFQPRSIWFFFFFFAFAANKKKYFWHLRSSLYPPSFLHLHSTYLTYYSLPALPTSQPVFFLSQCLPWEPWTTDLWFSFGFMSWCLTIEPCRLGCKFHYFFNYIYIVAVVINFLKLFKSDILLKENIPSIIIITLQYM